MDISITTPALLFPAITLLMLAYTNRFLALASVIRNFKGGDESTGTQLQIKNLHKRIGLIKNMQEVGCLSFVACVVAMLAIYLEYQEVGNWTFALSLVLLLYSLMLSVREIHISSEALEVHLSHCNHSK